MPRPILATISPSSLEHNLSVVSRKLAQEGERSGRMPPHIWAVIKANAYGHDIDNALRGFRQADGLAMLDLNEAIRCRQAGWTKPILLLEGIFQAADIKTLDQYRLSMVLHCQEQIDMLKSVRPARPLDTLVKFNTGMNRLGFSESQFGGAYQQVLAAQRQGILGTVGKMTHFARADDDLSVTQAQIRLFNEVSGPFPGTSSVCNSAGTLTPDLWRELPADAEQWIRPGICLYGASPFDDRSAKALDLLPAMTFSSQVIGTQSLVAGDGVGYGHTFVATRDMRIGIVACGYADGYPRHAPNGTPIAADGVATRLVGRVSMDMLAIDLSDIPAAGVGSPVVMWGRGGPSVDDVARASATIGYELLCAVAPRVPRAVL